MFKTIFKIIFSLSLLFSVVYGVVFHEDIFSFDFEKKAKQLKLTKTRIEVKSVEKKPIVNEMAWFGTTFSK